MIWNFEASVVSVVELTLSLNVCCHILLSFLPSFQIANLIANLTTIAVQIVLDLDKFMLRDKFIVYVNLMSNLI